jgi:hypothetical protein
VFRIEQQDKTLVNLWRRIASGTRSGREALEVRLATLRG